MDNLKLISEYNTKENVEDLHFLKKQIDEAIEKGANSFLGFISKDRHQTDKDIIRLSFVKKLTEKEYIESQIKKLQDELKDLEDE